MALAIVLSAAAGGAAQTETKQTVPDEYSARTAKMTSGEGSTLSFQVLRWSSDADRERVLSVVTSDTKKNSDELGRTLAALPTVGYIWATGPLGYALKYSHRLMESDGSERIVVMTDRPLGSWEQPVSKTTGQAAEPAPLFTVIELRIDKKGKGDGRISSTTPQVDEKTKTLGIASRDTALTLLTDVQRKPKPYWARQGEQDRSR